MMYRSRYSASPDDRQLRVAGRVLAISCLILLCLSIVLGIALIRSNIYRSRSVQELRAQMENAVASAVDEGNKLASGVASNTYARLARIRQYVYHAEQINNMSITLSGSGGRLAPDEAFTALYSDLNTYETVTQAATSSSMDIRARLMTHLTALQAWLDAEQ